MAKGFVNVGAMRAEFLDSKLTEPIAHVRAPKTFGAELNAHGSYHTEHFVLRLSPRVHALVGSIANGVYNRDTLSPDLVQAYSTLLHETVHWWQHMGSTAGFLYSMANLSRTYAAAEDLRKLVGAIGAKKSIKSWSEAAAVKGLASPEVMEWAYSVVNNAIDLEFYSEITSDPRSLQGSTGSRYFESMAHTYRMSYEHALGLTSQAADPTYAILPNPDAWADDFKRLAEAEHPGFGHGHLIRGAPVGLCALFEGQARFAQLQYLDGGLGGVKCDPRLYTGIYGEAFEAFLTWAEINRPERIDDPAVGLFLLICDLALNPTRGLPLPIEVFETFLVDVDSGARFIRLCRAAAEAPDLKSAIKDYTREEYSRVSEELAARAGYDAPLAALSEIARWRIDGKGFEALLAERETFRFGEVNLPVRVLVSHFLAFSGDKLKRPEFFCWPGRWMTGARAGEETQALFVSHLALFADKQDDDGVFPRILPGKDEEAVKKTFNTFFANVLIYDLVTQWILRDGPFVYDFKWLSQRYSEEEIAARAKLLFENLFGASPDAFEEVTPPSAEEIAAAVRAASEAASAS